MNQRIWKAVSVLFSVPVVALLIGQMLRDVAYGGSSLGRPFLLFIGFYVVVPVLVGAWMYRADQFQGFGLRYRAQRLRPLRLSVAASGVGLVVFVLLGMHWLFIGFAVAHLVTTAALYGITRRWKISIHGATMGVLLGVAVVVARLESPFILLFTILVGIARVRLRRHTLRQYVAGVGLGIVVLLASLFLTSTVATMV